MLTGRLRVGVQLRTFAESLAVISGVPEELLKKKKVIIYQPTKNAMQSGGKGADVWKLEWDLPTEEIGGKWQNPTMGWTSTADPLSQTRLRFKSAESAIDFAKRNGWEYEIRQPKTRAPYSHTEYFPGGGVYGGTFWRGQFSDTEEDK
eukprot:c1882_g1_i1.p1 GENE.c1882_g1_i1~~c1882_g1_i1.p1  ORF type:complete len:148 (-),score=31.51 c1882_g1_i1:69-512(-)